MVSFSDICIFVLATTKHFQGLSVWNTRVVPIVETWGSLFSSNSLLFIFGTNVFDHKFLNQNCSSIDMKSSFYQNNRRKLKAHTPQTARVDSMDFYQCPTDNNNNSNQKITVAFSGNCTGEYFGIGPVCRCQEALRTFYYSDKNVKKNWFIFIDDDIYIRPYALVSFLDEYDKIYGHDTPVAFLPSSYMLRGFKFSNRWNKNKHRCDEHEFNLAQPIIMNRAAVRLLKSAIDANGLVRLQHTWGGTHDAILGLLLWIYNIPTYSIHDFFWAEQILQDNLEVMSRNHRLKTAIIFHRIRNMDLNVASHGPKIMKHAISQYDLAILLNETSSSYKNKVIGNLIETTQRRLGSFSIQTIKKIKNSTVDKTVFHDKAQLLKDTYFDFHPSDCDGIDSIPTFARF